MKNMTLLNGLMLFIVEFLPFTQRKKPLDFSIRSYICMAILLNTSPTVLTKYCLE